MKKWFVLSCLAAAALSVQVHEPSVHGQEIEVEVEEIEMEAPLLGGFNRKPLESAAAIRSFVEAKLNDLRAEKLTSYEVQVVNGFNHRLIYRSAAGTYSEVIIYEDIDGRLSLPIVSAIEKDQLPQTRPEEVL